MDKYLQKLIDDRTVAIHLKVGKHNRPGEDKLITSKSGHTIEVDTIHDLKNMQLHIQNILCKKMFSYYKSGELRN